MVKIRSLDTGDTAPHGDETGFARAVFGDSLDFNRIRVTNLSGFGTRAFTTPTIDGTILLNIGNAYDSPTTSVDPPHGYVFEGQILIHELTHAWQIQHTSLADGYIPGLLCQGIYNQEVTGRAAYQYGPPGPPWSPSTSKHRPPSSTNGSPATLRSSHHRRWTRPAPTTATSETTSKPATPKTARGPWPRYCRAWCEGRGPAWGASLTRGGFQSTSPRPRGAKFGFDTATVERVAESGS